MNAALQALRDGKAALDAQNPGIFWILLAVLAWGLVFSWRKVHAASFEKVPKPLQFLPAATLTAVVGAVVAGSDAKSAFYGAISGALDGAAAVGGHHILKTWWPLVKVVLESMRGGGGSGGAASGSGAGATRSGPSSGPSPFQRRALVYAFVVGLMVALSSCSTAQFKQGARTALDIAQIACVFSTKLSSEEDVAKACGIESELRPHLRDLLEGKAAAQRQFGARAPECPAAVPPPAGASDAGLDR